MTDDIVTRLRDSAWVPAGATDESKDDRLFREAADEIERLRKELTTEQTLVMLGQVDINHLQEWKQVANMFGECFRMDEFGQSPVSDGQDVFQATLAWERLRTKEARHD